MQADLEFDSLSEIFGFADEGVGPEVRSSSAGDVESRRVYTRAEKAFFLEAEGPWRGRFRLYVDEASLREVEASKVPDLTFRLGLPSGRLSVIGVGSAESGTKTVDVSPGDYAVSVFDLRPEAADEADWRLYERVNHFGALGCLSLALGMAFVLIPYTRREYWFLLPLFLLPTGAFIFLRRLPGYARISERVREQGAGQPHYVISMQRVEGSEGS